MEPLELALTHRHGGGFRADAADHSITVEARTFAELQRATRAAVRARYGRERTFVLMVGVPCITSTAPEERVGH